MMEFSAELLETFRAELDTVTIIIIIIIIIIITNEF